jgi:Glycosyltransferase family 87
MTGMWLALRKVGPYALFGVLPVVTLVLFVSALRHIGTGTDFKYELYPEAKLVLHGKDPFASLKASLVRGTNRIFPVPAAVLVAPLTVFPVKVASYVFAFILLVLLALTAWIMGIRDWRLYGLLVLWPASLAAIQSGNLTIILGLLVAVAWRWRDRRYVPGIAIGVAIALKLFLWPLLVWLLAIRAYRSAALGAAIGVAGGFLTVLPFTSLSHFVRLENKLGTVFGPDSYNLIGFLKQSHLGSYRTATMIATAVGIVVLAVAYRRKSLPLALSASLLLSPIVWLHYFALLLVALAVHSRTLSWLWFVPLLLWVCPGTANEVRLWEVVLGVAVLAVVTVCNEWRPEFRPTLARASMAEGPVATTPAGIDARSMRTGR